MILDTGLVPSGGLNSGGCETGGNTMAKHGIRNGDSFIKLLANIHTLSSIFPFVTSFISPNQRDQICILPIS